LWNQYSRVAARVSDRPRREDRRSWTYAVSTPLSFFQTPSRPRTTQMDVSFGTSIFLSPTNGDYILTGTKGRKYLALSKYYRSIVLL
jgi:hypothetical protein